MTEPVSRPVSRGDEFKAGWPIVLSASLGIGLGLSPVPFYTIGLLAPELVKEFGWGFGQVMAGLSVMTITVILVAPLVGQIADRFGTRWVTLGSVLAFGLAFMGFALNNGSLPLYYALWALVALAGSGTLPMTWTRVVNGVFDKGRGLALGLSLLGTGLFGYLVKPYTAWLITEFGWRGAYLAIGILPILIALPVGLAYFRDPGTSAAAKAQEAISPRAPQPGLSFGEAVRHWRFWVIGFSFLPVSFAVGGVIPNLEKVLTLAGFDKGEMITLVQLIGLSVVFGRVLGGWLIDRFWAPGVALVLIGAPSLSCLYLAQSGMNFELTGLSILIIGFGAGVEYDLMAYLVGRYFGLKSYSAIYGAQYGFFAAGAGSGPAIFALMYDRTGSFQMPMLIAAGLLLFGALILLSLGRYREFAPPVEQPAT